MCVGGGIRLDAVGYGQQLTRRPRELSSSPHASRYPKIEKQSVNLLELIEATLQNNKWNIKLHRGIK
jgi:hypothetical protein